MPRITFLQRRLFGRFTGAELLQRVLWLPVLIVMVLLAVFFFALFATLLLCWIILIVFRLWRARRAWHKTQQVQTGPLKAEYRVIEDLERIAKRKR